jgi:hypothetical protein
VLFLYRLSPETFGYARVLQNVFPLKPERLQDFVSKQIYIHRVFTKTLSIRVMIRSNNKNEEEEMTF